MRLQAPAWLACGFALLLSAAGAVGQGTFQNLDFEAANIPNGTPPGSVAATNGLPGWSVYYGSSQQSQVGYNSIALGSTWVTLVGANDPFGPNCIEGSFGVFLQGGTTATDASIRQTSLIPVLTQSILFKARPGSGVMLLSLGVQNISYFLLSTGPNYTLYGADISAFANQTEQLEFSVLRETPSSPDNAWNLDSIVFSRNPIPEPGVFALSALGALLVGWRVLGRRR